MLLLNGGFLPVNLGWRLAFGIGAALALGVLALRIGVPESPRWLMLRGKEEDANNIVHDIEANIAEQTGEKLAGPEGEKLRLTVRDHTPWKEIFHNMWHDNRQRSMLALSLMVAQSFFYNSVFFTYGLVLDKFFKVDARHLPMHLLPFALGNFFGPLLLARFFDSVGRKPMIVATFGLAGVLLAAVSIPFGNGALTPRTLDIAFTAIFFVASSAASAAYLTVSEIFSLEIRALAIAIFYAVGTLIGGVGAPYLFGVLIASGSQWNVAYGYLAGAA